MIQKLRNVKHLIHFPLKKAQKTHNFNFNFLMPAMLGRSLPQRPS